MEINDFAVVFNSPNKILTPRTFMVNASNLTITNVTYLMFENKQDKCKK